jgi:Ca2+-binding EF-hand superfamily protein
MNKFTKSAIIGALTIGAASVAFAGEGKHGHGGSFYKHFDQVDANSDGFVTQDEMTAHHAAKFTEKDTDNDGGLSKDEMRATMVARMEKHLDHVFEKKDKDSDGKLTQSEMAHKGGRMFEKIDTDGDGKISKDEAKKMRKHRKNAG